MIPLPQFRTRRIILILIAVLSFGLFVHIATRIYAFAHIFGVFKPHSGVRITQGQVASTYNISKPEIQAKKPVIPKILHQIFHNWKDPGNSTLPAHWAAARQSCIDNNPEWEIKVWRASARLGATT